jgi:hypothetical protein
MLVVGVVVNVIVVVVDVVVVPCFVGVVLAVDCVRRAEQQSLAVFQ